MKDMKIPVSGRKILNIVRERMMNVGAWQMVMHPV